MRLGREAELLDTKEFTEELRKNRRFWKPEWYAPLNPDCGYREFCMGDWMACFSNITVRSHLHNNNVLCDSMTNVVLRFPTGMDYRYRDAKGLEQRLRKFELDLLALVQKPGDSRLLIVESKTGIRPTWKWSVREPS